MKNNAEFLLGRVLQRSQRVLSTLPNHSDGNNSASASEMEMKTNNSQSVASLLDTATRRAEQIITQNPLSASDVSSSNTKKASASASSSASQPNDNYGTNPAITTTALAHLLWSHVLQDATHATVIDATAGNGNDSVFLAQLLFAQDSVSSSSSQLLCLDVQERACQVTRQRLADVLTESIIQNNVQVLQQSHASFPEACQEVSLVVYNLGYLPNSTHLEGDDAPDKNIKTNTESTLDSLMNAAIRMKVGGMLSIMTYPKSDAVEDAAVHAFCQGLALFSSRTHDWRSMFDNNHDDDTAKDPVVTLSPLIDANVQQQLSTNLETVLETLGRQTAWRVQCYSKMGWIDSPILLTAFRIK